MKFLNALVAGVYLDFGVWLEGDLGFFKQPEVMPLTVREGGTDDLAVRLADD